MRKIFRGAYHQEWLIKGRCLRYWPEEVWWPLPLLPPIKKAYWGEFKVFWEIQDRLYLAAGDGGMCLCSHCFGEEWK